MVKVYLVCGSEASGCHLATNILANAGVIKEEKIPPKVTFPIVYRRSFPHGGEWWTVERIVKPLMDAGLITYKDVHVIIPVRNWVCAIKSAVMRGHSKDAKEARRKLKRAYKTIFAEITLHNLDYTVFSYDECTRNPKQYLKEFYKALSLKVSNKQLNEIIKKITNENDKFYTLNYKPNRATDGY